MFLRCDAEGAGVVDLDPGIYEFRQDRHFYRATFQTVHHGVATAHSTAYLDAPEFVAAFDRGLALYPSGESERQNLALKVYTTASLAKQAPKGDFIEVGVSWGVFARTILDYAKPERFFLVDAWEGLYDDGEACVDYCSDIDFIRRSFPDAVPVQGMAPEILDTIDGEFAFVHLELDYGGDMEIACLEALVPRCVPGAIIIIENAYSSQSSYGQNLDLAAKALGVTITGTAQGQGIIIIH
ncbi:hypothetical protein L2D14_12230 [Thalassospiraceae bacterium LMO-JJ14]|nr:hypothetical protein L2D14_12230 [Thalassospiraceae bacterium LMO-JJ14]